MTDTITSQNIDFSSWDTLYTKPETDFSNNFMCSARDGTTVDYAQNGSKKLPKVMRF
jgi:beta-galactosidase GanA